MYEHYGTIDEANTYFDNRLHSRWHRSAVADRPKALLMATQLIDALNFKGCKHAVWLLPDTATPEQIRAAEASQALEFPRGSDTEVPWAIKRACFEVAHALLNRRDPEMELENLAVTSQGYESARTTFNRTMQPIEHLINLIPSAIAWELIRPFLRDEDTLRLTRV